MSKSEQLEQFLKDSNLDFLCLSETWLTPTTPISVFTVPGYNAFRRDRGHGKGGGVLIYVNNDITCKQIDFKNDNSVECVGITVILSPQISFNIVGMYRPPSSKDVFFQNYFRFYSDF